MLFRTLTLHDFRTYGGRHTLDLQPPSPSKPIILFGGLNGAGKTTLLDALQLALYGPRARLASRGSMGYQEYLRQTIHRNSDPSDGASVELTFSHVVEGVEHDYTVRRSWYATDSSVRERVEVEVDAVPDKVLTDQWDERVDDFAPHRISHLFFFDGEKIASMASESASAGLLKTAIHSLLGLELVDRLVGDLAILDRKKRKASAHTFDRTALDALEKERDRLQTEVQELAEERARLRTQQDQAASTLSEVNELYRREGGELADQRSTLEAQHRDLSSRREELRASLRELASGPLPFLQVSALLQEALDQAHSEEEAQRTAALGPILADRDATVLTILADSGAPSDLVELVSSILDKDRQTRSNAPTADRVYDLSGEEVRELDRLVHAELPQFRAQASKQANEITYISEQLLVVERKINSIPEEGDLALLRDRRAEASREVHVIDAKLEALAERRRVTEGHLENTAEKYRRELESELAALSGEEELHKRLSRVQMASSALESYRGRILQENIRRVEAAILESFRELIRKPRLISSLRIDPDSFQLELLGPQQTPLDRSQLSAGENQLLAAAMLWGLARTAGLPIPVVIDTPLGRLDSKHRSNLVEYYYPLASHQVLLLSTDEEIIKHRFDDLSPYIGRSFLLEHDTKADRTVAVEGYFTPSA